MTIIATGIDLAKNVFTVHGVNQGGTRDDPTSRWLKQLIERVGWQKACVAMANKNARILWAVMTRDQGFDPQHVSAKPAAKQKPAPAPAAALAAA